MVKKTQSKTDHLNCPQKFFTKYIFKFKLSLYLYLLIFLNNQNAVRCKNKFFFFFYFKKKFLYTFEHFQKPVKALLFFMSIYQSTEYFWTPCVKIIPLSRAICQENQLAFEFYGTNH